MSLIFIKLLFLIVYIDFCSYRNILLRKSVTSSIHKKTKMATARTQEEMKRNAEKAIATSKDPIEILRARCLARGANGIRGLSRLFKIMDDSKDHRLDFDEFRKGISEYGFNYSKSEYQELFNAFDENKSGKIFGCYNEWPIKIENILKIE